MAKNPPKTFYESKNGRKRMEVIDKNPWSEKKRVGRADMLVPKWVVGVGTICGVLILAFLIGSIVFALKVPRPSLYGESCDQRTCLPSNGLVCINKTCSCLENQYYATRCLDKKNYGEKCSATVPCKDGTNMVCRDGVCKCLDVNYWYNSSCIAKKTHKQSCTSNNECLTSLMLNCDLTSNTCICNKTRYWDGEECQLLRTINETCKKTSECISSKNLQCLNGTCKCNSTIQYWDTVHFTCYSKIYENTSCTATYQCYSPMTCNNTYCMCAPYQYHNLTSLSCINQKLVNQPCSVDFNCRVDKGLECNSGTCQCISIFPVWSSTYGMCIQRKNYGETICANQNECQLGKNLICYLTGPSNCSCPLTRRVNMCDCYRVYGNESYWNGIACTPALINGSSCENASTTYQCQSLTQGTICNVTDTGDYICQCPIYKYLDVGTNKCLNQELESGSCSVTIGCRVDLGLYCSSGVCVCNSTYQYWSSTNVTCQDYNTYKDNCNSNGECDPRLSLICNSGTACNCPTTLTTGKCDCVRNIGNEFYWNGTSCVPALTNGTVCGGASKTYTCKTLTQGTVCNGTSGNYYCQCVPYYYFDATQNKCVAQVSNGVSCTMNIACRIDLGLSCVSGSCSCNSTYQFWSTTLLKCINYKTYAQTCGSDLCDPRASLICNTGTACNCPTSLGKGYCDCTRVSGNETYWNGSSCVSCNAYGGKCTAGNTYECQTLAVTGVICDSSGICQCNAANGGLQSSTNKCVVCSSGWKYFDPNCYKVGSSKAKADKCDEIKKSCGDSACNLAEMSNALVKAYLDSIAGSNKLWVDLNKASGTTYTSSNGWTLTTDGSSTWCSGNTAAKENCVFYNAGASPACYDDEKCDKDNIPSCQYTP